MKNLFTLILILLSFNIQAQNYPVAMELEIQRYEIIDINTRLNSVLDLVDESGRQGNIALGVGLGGGLLSTLMIFKGKTSSVRNTGLAIGCISVAASLYFTIESNNRLREVSELRKL